MRPVSSAEEVGALLSRSDSSGRRRRSSPVQSASPRPAGCGCGGPRRQSSFRDDVGHAASETYLVTRLTFSLLQYLGLGYRWMSQLLALTIYAILLMPAWFGAILSSIRGRKSSDERNRKGLDLYIPKDINRPCPVVAFVTGGAWIIGYKAWGSLLGRRLAERGIIVACIDYRNFPQGTIGDMVSDASQGISYVCNNIASYGGDPNRIYLVGQSAGAHIAACALIEQAVKESSGQSISWSVTQIKAYFGLSGGIMEGEESLSRYSPEIVVKQSSSQTIALLPPIVLMHGTEDYSIPSSASQTFADVLQQAGAQAKLQLYEGKTHTDIFIQDPLRGGRDPLVEDVLSIIHVDDEITQEKIALAPAPRRLVFEWQLQLARRISPFYFAVS
uniref:protein-S-isoprenylcysteine alpha-carbonyl methylesterase n=2 Tax=Oryza glumipatula TaxID=40148 RepID=A0A0D9YC87_9ORYZ